MVATSSSSSNNNSDDICMWLDGARCGVPRSCRACLTANNNNEAGGASSQCALNPLGACVSQHISAATTNNASYCAVDDTACSRCAQQWRADAAHGAVVPLTASCVGADGCVCLAACELPTWSTQVLEAAQCNNSNNNNNNNRNIAAPTTPLLRTPEPSNSLTTGQILVGGAICFAAVLMFALISLGLGKLVRKMDRSALVTRRERLLFAFRLPRRAPTGPTLELAGWTTMREKLVQDSAPPSAFTLAPPVAIAPEYAHRSSAQQQQDQRELSIRW